MRPARIQWSGFLAVGAAVVLAASVSGSPARHPDGGGIGNATSTTLTSSTNPSIVGQAVILTARVAALGLPNPQGGSVRFFEKSTILGTVPLPSNGLAMFTTSSLAAGNHVLTAEFLGFGTYLPSISALFNQAVALPGSPIPTLGSLGRVLLGLALATSALRLIRR